MSASKQLATFGCGLLFGAGLAISGMTRPEKVLGFLDVTGHWDGSLLFVLGGAVACTIVAFRWILKRRAPLFGGEFDVPKQTAIDRKLVIGSIVFGLGWGAAGYCPGPAIALLAQPNREALYFLPSLFIGWGLYRFLFSRAGASAGKR
ncbi:DUF6691 family protein [Pararobbsia silviterrae]|uniref:YeeE/YedE family protein n=1 Tax=Pararobbsia silviterrae TaxID=1792498 RepID=A0A494XST4_9BURK|nr:DUF6691 family protein [Pararobbsia silviterrae]RKP53657.1 YeeE/YedE family protein [Pararobbsia silviterrae]